MDSNDHLRACYVLDQVGNRDQVKKVNLAELPEGTGRARSARPKVVLRDAQSPAADGRRLQSQDPLAVFNPVTP
jgi:hypothetical protein